MELYVLTSGEYSDYSFEGVFTSLEKLEEYKQKYPRNQYDKYNDPFKTEVDCLAEMAREEVIYEVSFSEGVTEVQSYWQQDHSINPLKDFDVSGWSEETHPYWSVLVKTKSPTHAIKIASDTVRAIRAQRELDPVYLEWKENHSETDWNEYLRELNED